MSNMKTFRELISDCGGEFCNSDKEEISHGGSIDSGPSTAHLGILLTNGITVSIVSDQGSTSASLLYRDVKEYALSQD